MRLRATVLVLALAASAVLTSGTTSYGSTLARPSVPVSGGSARFLMWTNDSDCLHLSESKLMEWKSRGAGGFVCGIGMIDGVGGSQAFAAAPPATLAASKYELERELASNGVVSRASALGMSMYLSFELANDSNPETPLAPWFDNSAWSGVVLPQIENLAAAAKQLGFAGVAVDQELYDVDNLGKEGTWNWDYPGNTHTEAQVRAEAQKRGNQVMRGLLEGFPDIRIPVYDAFFPGTWDAAIESYAEGTSDPYGNSVQIDFWNGLTAADGYAEILFLDATFFREPGIPGASWDAALQYEDNSLFAELSQKLSNWAYASSRIGISPFGWIDQDPEEGSYGTARPPQYVASQLAAFRRWSMDGTIGIFSSDGLGGFDYTPYLAGMRAATKPGGTDNHRPQLTAGQPEIRTGPRKVLTVLLKGTAVDSSAIRAVYWHADSGKAGGAARMVWKRGTGGVKTGWVWTMDWSLAASVPEGTKSIEVAAVSIKGPIAVAKISLDR